MQALCRCYPPGVAQAVMSSSRGDYRENTFMGESSTMRNVRCVRACTCACAHRKTCLSKQMLTPPTSHRPVASTAFATRHFAPILANPVHVACVRSRPQRTFSGVSNDATPIIVAKCASSSRAYANVRHELLQVNVPRKQLILPIDCGPERDHGAVVDRLIAKSARSGCE